MRSWLLLALALTSACSDSPPIEVMDGAGAARPLDLDVVIANGQVTLYTSESDLAGTGCDGGDVFPDPGRMASMSDIVTCQQGRAESCLTRVALKLDGTEVTAAIRPGWKTTMTGDVEAAGGGQLIIAGCGGSAEIELPVASVSRPRLSATVDEAAGTITSTWSAAPSPASALIEMNAAVWADAAHVTDSPYVFTVFTGGSIAAYRNVTITTFGPPTIAASTFGPVRIWTGGFMTVPLP